MKARKPNTEMLTAAKAIFMAIAYKEMIEPKIESIKSKCFNAYDFINKRTGESITTPEDLYLSRQEEQCNKYYLDCHTGYLKAGFEVEKYHCPLLIAESTEREAKRLLVEESIKWLNMGDFEGIYYNMNQYNKFVELNLKLCSNFIKV